MAGAEEVLDALEPEERARCAALVLNERGFERSIVAEVPELHLAVMATEGFSRRNSNASVEQSLADVLSMGAQARVRGVRVSVAIGVAFGCPFEGRVDPAAVAAIADRLAPAVDEIVLADTIGVAVPSAVGRLCREVSALGRPIGAHMHNTRNTGYANAWAALQAGATLFEASAGGIGGCPFAPHATGNVATEDLVYLLEREGVRTGVDLDALVGTVAWLEELLGRELPGQLLRAGAFPAHDHAAA
jgi:hydroxymethylglutaryl-CoA lyase/(R)-citramalyl-CoA lyase